MPYCLVFAIYGSYSGFVTRFPVLSLTRAMATLSNKLQGNQEPKHTKESRGAAARLTDDSSRSKKESPKGIVSPNPPGDMIAKKLVANAGKIFTLPRKPAMADRTNNLKGNHEPLHAEETRTGKAQRTDYAREAKNGKKQGPASPIPSRNIIANKVTANKKMDDRVKMGKPSNAEGRDAVCARIVKNRARGNPPPKRGGVTKAIAREVAEEVVAGVKKVIDTGKTLCCAPESFDVDTFVVELPTPTRSELTATLWAKVEV